MACLKTNKMEEDNLKEFKARILALLMVVAFIGGLGSFIYFTIKMFKMIF